LVDSQPQSFPQDLSEVLIARAFRRSWFPAKSTALMMMAATISN
jgi:hypothetical protein